MRIIGGSLKGKKINFLQNEITRPLRDLVKESIFNIINHSAISKVDIINSSVLDLYSGIGSFGLEAISRGAKKVCFVENDKKAFQILIKNLNYLEIENKALVYHQKVEEFLFKNKEKKFDIIFLDPPFKSDEYLEYLNLIKEMAIFNKNHLIIFYREISKNEKTDNILNNFSIKNYGRSKLIYGDFN